MNKLDPMKVVLSVVDPEYPNDIPVEKIVNNMDLLKAAMKLAEKNGLYYYFILRLKELNIDLSFLDEERWNKETQKLSELKETITLLNKVSSDYGIDYIIIKACNTIPHIPRDVDIFVRKEEKRKVIEALENNGMECVHLDVANTVLKGKNMDIDVYIEICYIGVEFIDESFLWKSSVKDKMFEMEYPSLNEEANFLLMQIHRLLGHRSMSLLDFLHMNSLKDDININACRRYAYEKGWGSVFDLTLNELDTLHERIYKEGEVIPFPYLFDRNFILKCVSGIGGLDMSRCNKIFFHLFLIQYRVIYELKDTPLYNLLKSFEPVGNLINSSIAFVKKMRGDEKSVDKYSRWKKI